MTPADPVHSAPRASHSFPLRAQDGVTTSDHSLHNATKAFALHLTEAEHGVSLHQGAPMHQRATDPRTALRTASHEFEAAFLRQMLTAMRASVPHVDLADENNPGEDMYTSLLDDRLASVAAARSHNGLGDAMYRQLSTPLLPGLGTAPRSDR